MTRAVALRGRSLPPLEPGIFVELPAIALSFYLWSILSIDRSMQDFHALRGAAHDVLAGVSPYPLPVASDSLARSAGEAVA